MALLTRTDFRAVLEFLQGCYAIQDLDGFVVHVLSNLPKLVPSEATVYTEYNHKRNRVFWQQDPVDFAFPGSERIWERYSHEHPFIDHFRKTKDGRAVKFSDLVSARTFHRTGLYNEFFRPLNIRHQMTFLLQEPGTILSAIALNRGAKDFAERERLILNLLRPHMMQAYRNAEAVAELQQELIKMRGALEKLDRGVIFLSAGGKVQGMTQPAREYLKQFFGRQRGQNRLPTELAQWLGEQIVVACEKDRIPPPRKALVVERKDKQLSVRLVSGPGENLLILEERRTMLDLSILERLGLTRREAEVLSWIAQGKTNGEIGWIVGSRPRTVEKHVERILGKLAVETRTAAAALAMQLSASNDRL